MQLSTILERNHNKIALVIGNGINRYGITRHDNAWHSLLLTLAQKHLSISRLPTVDNGISLTEFYDILEIAATEAGVKRSTLRRDFCQQMQNWKPDAHHRAIVSWAKRHCVPILATNFDKVLRHSEKNMSRFWSTKEKRTDFYPWECHYAPRKVTDPTRDFAIWHINGMQAYSRSIRLSLSDYMGSVRRARRWLHSHPDNALFRTRDITDWRGKKTWLQIVMTKRLVILGLALEANEVFLRWLLI